MTITNKIRHPYTFGSIIWSIRYHIMTCGICIVKLLHINDSLDHTD